LQPNTVTQLRGLSISAHDFWAPIYANVVRLRASKCCKVGKRHLFYRVLELEGWGFREPIIFVVYGHVGDKPAGRQTTGRHSNSQLGDTF